MPQHPVGGLARLLLALVGGQSDPGDQAGPGRPVSSTYSPYQLTRFVSRWTTSSSRYLPATNSCVETCVLTMAIPR